MKPKKELVRVVRAPVKEDENGVQTGGEVSLDLTGRKPGRGAYVCRIRHWIFAPFGKPEHGVGQLFLFSV